MKKIPTDRPALVMICSPYSGDIIRNVSYAKMAVRDSLKRGEVPFAPHLHYPQPGILNDDDPDERELGMMAGMLWMYRADGLVVYRDHGITKGMQEEIDEALRIHHPIEYRVLHLLTTQKDH
jgi:hypothetical protein